MKRTLIGCLITVGALFVLVSGAQAYQFYSVDTNDVGGCGQCHGVFRSGKYISPVDGEAWGVHLHAGHLNNTAIGGNCSNCHDGAGVAGRTVNLSSSGTAADGVNALSCSGCHGRLEDSSLGAGLRLHHINAGAPADSNGEFCNDCHNDATPVGEDTMPAWYATFSLNPCNVNEGEDFTGNGLGNDNDGDLDYDGADSDCGVTPDCTDDVDCDNGEFCDGAETCDGAGVCQPGTAPVIDDGVGCTDDSCNEVNDTVVNAPIDANCDDNNVCNGAETWDPTNDCQSGTTLDCDDGLLCTIDTCDAIDGCANDPVVCQTGEQCDPADGICKATAECTVDADCDNGLSCDGAETCDGAGACQAGTPVDCSDGVACTEDFCEEVAGCVNIPSDANCDNGLFCDGAETCDPVSDCQAGTDPCGGEVCNETPDTCGAATCADYLDSGTCQADSNCEWVGKGKNASCQDIQIPEPEICTDGVDNDLDDLTDCDDPDCFGIDGCPIPSGCSVWTDRGSCNNDSACEWVGNPKNGTCQDATVCVPDQTPETTCTDGVDNDCDGVTDCADTADCGGDPACQGGSCDTYGDKTSCQSAGCTWSNKDKVCM